MGNGVLEQAAVCGGTPEQQTAPRDVMAESGYAKVRTQEGRGNGGTRCKGVRNDAEPDAHKVITFQSARAQPETLSLQNSKP